MLGSKRIYLAGPIHDCNVGEQTHWREEAAKILEPLQVFDPSVHFFSNNKEVIEHDKKLIRKSDALLVNYWKHSAGTAMEMLYARMLGIPVYLVLLEPRHGGLPSPWLLHHCTMWCQDLKEACEIIKKDSESW